MSFDLPELDHKKTKKAVRAALEKYRIMKYLAIQEKEANVTSSAEIRYHGPTNETGDDTANAAVYNANEEQSRKAYCEQVERCVERLPPQERFLIEVRYMANDADYKTDHGVYNFEFDPPISETTYTKLRWRAFYKLALSLDIGVYK